VLTITPVEEYRGFARLSAPSEWRAEQQTTNLGSGVRISSARQNLAIIFIACRKMAAFAQ